VHVASFRAGFPLELHPFNCGAPNVRMNRHEYCELMYIYSGCGEFQIQDREFEVRSGDLVVGPSLHHRVYLPAGARMNIAVLFFQPELLNGSLNGGERYLSDSLLSAVFRYSRSLFASGILWSFK
jgi:hypothetical protein